MLRQGCGGQRSAAREATTHRRRPKFSGPPGLALPEMTPEVTDGSSGGSPRASTRRHEREAEAAQPEAAHPSGAGTLVQDAVAALVREAVASEMRDLRSRVADTHRRLERMEVLLFRASFEDFARIDRFISQAAVDDEAPSRPSQLPSAEAAERPPSGRDAPRPEALGAGAPCGPDRSAAAEPCGGAGERPAPSPRCGGPSELRAVEEYEQSEGFCAEEPLELLSGMAGAPPGASCPILLHPSCLHGAAAAAGAEKSFHARREARRESTQKLVARARSACRAEGVLGQKGTLEDLVDSLSVGSLLESTSFMDVMLRGADGGRCRTAGPVIQVTSIQGKTITFKDGSPQPAVDRRGNPVLGQTTMSDEVFCVVGHSKLGGVQVAYAELLEAQASAAGTPRRPSGDTGGPSKALDG